MTVVMGEPAAGVLFRLRATLRLLSAVHAGIRGNAWDTAFAGHGRSGSRRGYAAFSAQLVLPFVRGRLVRLIVTGVKGKLGPLPFEIDLQGRHPGGEIRFCQLQLATFLTVLRMPLQLSGSLLGLLFPTQR